MVYIATDEIALTTADSAWRCSRCWSKQGTTGALAVGAGGRLARPVARPETP
jgi:hypothetical protein